MPPTTRSQTRAAPRAHRAAAGTSTTKKQQKLGVKRKQEQSTHSILINRAPVLTLWAAVVAESEGFSWTEGLTFGRWISGILAQSKGRSLGIYEPHEKTEAETRARRQRDVELGVHKIRTFGMQVPVVRVGNEDHAVSQGKPISPDKVYDYLVRSFTNASTLNAAKKAMKTLAQSISKNQGGAGTSGQKQAYALYERFRPEWKGWGKKGHLNLNLIRDLAE